MENDNDVSLENIIRNYRDCFTGIGCLPGEYNIEIDNLAKPIKHRPRRVPVPILNRLKEEINAMVKEKVIVKETGPSDWINSMVIVEKKNNKLRICIDPRDLNKCIKRSHYQTPTLEEMLPNLNKAKIFSVLDAKCGFWQVKLTESSSKLTTFWTPFGRYRWLRMPFGISSAPEEFQRRLHEGLEDLKGIEVIADDVLVYGSGDTLEEATLDHDKNFINLLERARLINLKFNKEKIRFKMPQVKYMGHILSREGLKPDPDKVKAVRSIQVPTNKRDLQRFLGFVNYLGKFLPGLSTASEPLRILTREEVPWHWDDEQQGAFQNLKTMTTSTPILQYFDVNSPVTIQCDASDYGLGAALIQNRPVAFASRVLSPTERSYAQIEKECLAILFACQKFEQYIVGKKDIIIESDHQPLQIIFKKPLLNAPKRLQRMLLRLQKYDLKVIYKSGKSMHLADMLSRAPVLDKVECEENLDQEAIYQININREIEDVDQLANLNVTAERLTQIRKATEEDPGLLDLKKVIISGWPNSKEKVTPSVREYWHCRDELSIQDGIILRGSRLVVPSSLRQELMDRLHASHRGVDATLKRARTTLHWPRMSKDLANMISNCGPCQQYQPMQSRMPMESHKTPALPWEQVAIDIFQFDGKQFLVTVDYYSDYWEVQQLKTGSAAEVIVNLKRTFACHGIPISVISDNAQAFVGREFEEFARTWEFKHMTSSPYHSRGNGKAEAAVKIVKNLLKKTQEENTDIWLNILEWRNTARPDSNSSPAQKLFSRKTRTLVPETVKNMKPSVEEGVSEDLNKRKAIYKKYYDQRSKDLSPLESGQSVRVKIRPNSAEWVAGKVTDQVSPRSYLVEVDGRVYRRNREFIRPAPCNIEVNVRGQPTPHRKMTRSGRNY